jgi:hypothetical protein
VKFLSTAAIVSHELVAVVFLLADEHYTQVQGLGRPTAPPLPSHTHPDVPKSRIEGFVKRVLYGARLCTRQRVSLLVSWTYTGRVVRMCTCTSSRKGWCSSLLCFAATCWIRLRAKLASCR